MLADAAAGRDRGCMEGRDVVGVRDERVSSRAEGGELHLVVPEVGLLRDHRHAVRERPAHGVDRLELLLLDDAARRRDRRQQRDVANGVRVRLDRKCVGALELCLQGRGQHSAAGRVDRLGAKDQEHGVPGRRPGRRHGVDFGQRDLREHGLNQRPLDLDAGSRRVREEVIPVLGSEAGRGLLIALLVGALHGAEQVRLLAIQLAGGKAMPGGALDLLEQGLESALGPGLLRDDREGQDVERPDECRAPGPGPEVGRIGGLSSLEQPRVQHHEGELLDGEAPEGRHVASALGSNLADQGHLGAGRLGVREDVDDRFGVVGDVVARQCGGRRDGGARLAGLALGRRGEVLPDLRLDQLWIEVTDGYDGHQVRPVPALVVRLQLLDGSGLDDLGEADRGPLRVARGAEEQRNQVVLEAGGEPLEQPPLLQHDAAFQLDLLRLERDGVGPVTEDPECVFENLGIVSRHLEEIDRGVEAGRGVQVRAKRAADRLEVVDDLLLGEALRAVEGHVLDEVGQPALLLLLEDGAGLHDQRKVGPVARLLVVPDVVGQAVAERAAGDRGVQGQRIAGLERHRRGLSAVAVGVAVGVGLGVWLSAWAVGAGVVVGSGAGGRRRW